VLFRKDSKARTNRNMTDINNDDDDFQDGWDDDDVDNLDLDDLDDDDDESGGESSNQNVMSEAKALPVETKGVEAECDDDDDDPFGNDDDAILAQLNTEIMDTTVEGWDEDEDILFEEIESSSPVVKEAVAVPVPIVSVAPSPPQKLQPPVSTLTNTRSIRSAAPAVMALPLPPPAAVVEKDIASEGWGDDDDDLFSEESESSVAAHENNNMTQAPAPAPTVPPLQQSPGKAVSTYSTIEDVMKASSSFDSSEASNDSKKFKESEGWDDDEDLMFDTVEDDAPPVRTVTRPPPPLSPLYTALEDYLLQLPRLQSSINAVLEYECNTDEKANELVQYYSERPGLTEYTVKKELPRMEYVLVQGPNKVVTDKKEIAQRLHQDASSLVSRCANQSLLADLLQVFTGPDLLVRPQYMAAALAVSCRFRLDLSQSLVQVQAQLDLCLPTENGRWKVAELLVRIDFCSQPDRPFVKYQLEAIRPAVQPNDPAWTLQLHGVVQMLGHLDLGDDDDAMHQAPAAMENNFRDVFLQQSQSMFQNSAVGMRSAWQEIDTVAGFSKKLGRLPRFDDVMQHAEIAAAAEAEIMSSAQERPTSILGGLFGKLAKSVALPDEDPSMYQDWQSPASTAPPAQPVLYSRSPAPSAPRFYNKETPSPQQRPQLYNKMTPPPPDHSRSPAPSAPRFYNKETPSPPQRPQLYNNMTPTPSDRPASQVPKLYNETPGRPPRGAPPTPLAQPPSPPQPPSVPTGTAALSHVKSTPPARAPVEPEVEDDLEPDVEDGWDDDLDLDVDDDEPVSTPVPSPLKSHAIEQQQQPVTVKLAPPSIDNDDNGDWVYNPVSDIIPTRKRWVNPRPGTRQLRSFATQ
jgi:hypothetical protein